MLALEKLVERTSNIKKTALARGAAAHSTGMAELRAARSGGRYTPKEERAISLQFGISVVDTLRATVGLYPSSDDYQEALDKFLEVRAFRRGKQTPPVMPAWHHKSCRH